MEGPRIGQFTNDTHKTCLLCNRNNAPLPTPRQNVIIHTLSIPKETMLWGRDCKIVRIRNEENDCIDL